MIVFRRCLTSVLSLLLFLLLSAPASARRATEGHRSPTAPNKAHRATVLRGRASWYGKEFQGRRTTSGERYNRFAYTCAHKTLPFGTRLRVTNPANGKSVVVRVTDRGPFRLQRILDLSEVAARPLNIVCCGSASVIAEIVPAATPLGPTGAPENLAALQAADPAPEARFTTYTMPVADSLVVATAVTASAPAPDSATVAMGTLVAPATSAFIVQAGTFGDPGNAQAMLARIAAIDESLKVALQPETISGKICNRVIVGNFADRPEAESVRRRLQVWGIGGLVREISE